MAPFRMGFRTRLALLFVLLAVVPIGLLTFFYLRYITGTIEYWQNPGIERTLENSLVVARQSLEHYRSEALSAGEFLLVVLDPGLGEAETSAFLDANAGEVGVDLLAVYRPEGGVWRRWARAGTGPAPEELDPGLVRIALDGSAHAPLDLNNPSVCALLPAGPPPVERILLVGVRPPAEIMESIRSLAADADLYRRLAGYERIQTTRIVIGTVAVLALVVIVALIVARILARSISSPILQLVDATRRLSSGDLEHSVDVKAKDEIGLLVSSFNQMTEDLRASKENLRRAERVAAWRDVARRIAHEIKNPLTPVQLSIHRLRKRVPEDDPPTAAVFKECLDLMDTEVAHLRRLADEFSQFARMPAPSPVLSDAGELVRSVADLYGESNPAVHRRLDVPDNLPSMAVDPGQFRQAVGNLIKNALEAMPGGGTLSVKVEEGSRAGATGLVISVTDTGPGLPVEIRDRVFDPYVTTKKQGSGLGLAIVHRIVSDHGGSVEVESPAAGSDRGATFRLFFPGPENPKLSPRR